MTSNARERAWPHLSLLLMLLATAIAPAPAAAAEAAQPLLAHGNDERFWLVQGQSEAGAEGTENETVVYRRSSGNDRWELASRLASRVVAMNSRGNQLVLLLSDGAWRLVSDESASTGPALPGGAEIVVFGNDGETLWAVGRKRGAGPASKAAKEKDGPSAPADGAKATTPPKGDTDVANDAGRNEGKGASPAEGETEVEKAQPADNAAAPAASQQSAAADGLSLYMLTASGWRAAGELPPVVKPADSTLSLSFIEDEPVIAWRDTPRSIQIHRFVANKAWERAAHVKLDFDVARFKLLAGTPRPVLWAVGTDARAALFWIESAGPKRVDLSAPAANRPQDMAAAYAIGRVRALWYEEGKLVEQTYDPLTGSGGGASAAVALPRTPVDPLFIRWLEPAVTLALIFTIIASVRRRREMRDLVLDPPALALAPVGRRLLAGTIDALPLLAPLVFYYARPLVDQSSSEEFGVFSRTQYLVLLAATGVYILHTSIAELLMGRSLGKLICGLKVVGLDGARAPVGAVLIRNLLRIIDVAMIFFPLVLILFSPLRQRAGDVAAGTLVVLNTAPQTADTDAPSPGATNAEE